MSAPVGGVQSSGSDLDDRRPPVGTNVELDIWTVFGRCETVPGTVVGHCGKTSLIIQTTTGHGRVVEKLSKVRVLT